MTVDVRRISRIGLLPTDVVDNDYRKNGNNATRRGAFENEAFELTSPMQAPVDNMSCLESPNNNHEANVWRTVEARHRQQNETPILLQLHLATNGNGNRNVCTRPQCDTVEEERNQMRNQDNNDRDGAVRMVSGGHVTHSELVQQDEDAERSVPQIRVLSTFPKSSGATAAPAAAGMVTDLRNNYNTVARSHSSFPHRWFWSHTAAVSGPEDRPRVRAPREECPDSTDSSGSGGVSSDSEGDYVATWRLPPLAHSLTHSNLQFQTSRARERLRMSEASVDRRNVSSVVVPSSDVERRLSNISNVQIVLEDPSNNNVCINSAESHQPVLVSTETQTGSVAESTISRNNREQRRRERRERRHQRRLQQQQHYWPPPPVMPPPTIILPQLQNIQTQSASEDPGGERLPDLLHSHLPPPYSTLPLNPEMRSPPEIPFLPSPTAGQGVGVVFPPVPFPGSRRSRVPRVPRGAPYTPDEEPKSCCGLVVTQAVSIRWFIVMIAFVGICCAIVGTVLGAMRAAGKEHLVVSLLMIGVGIVLITVSGVAWRLTSHDAPSCRMMLGLGGGSGNNDGAEPNRRFVPRLPPSYGRPHHPYAAMLYPEFQYRPPPPSYQASMQEYRLRLLLLDRPPPSGRGASSAISPPPTYRSHIGTALRPSLTLNRIDESSRPPSYRSRSSTQPRPGPSLNSVSAQVCTTVGHSVCDEAGGVNPCSGNSVNDSVVNVINVDTNSDISNELYVSKNNDSTTEWTLTNKEKDGNLVTIVQTTDSSQVIGRESVVVTVSGICAEPMTSQRTPQQGLPTLTSEVQILAHL